ncbi:MAG: histidine kinase [Terriglobia bacterium]
MVKAQEDERKLISRELHDEVGQLLTGLKMELAWLWKSCARSTGRPSKSVLWRLGLSVARLWTASGIWPWDSRPSMLDDLGLVPAIQWQSKEFSKRSGIPVDLQN